MKICLVSALTQSDFGDLQKTARAARKYSSPPLGVLSLAAVLEKCGLTPKVLNIDHQFIRYVEQEQEQEQGQRCGVDFPRVLVGHLEELACQVYGFSSICSSYPLTVRIAREIKRRLPESKIVFGGPQASMVDTATMERFPFVDYVVRGEAEETLPRLLDVLTEGEIELENIPGLTFRNRTGRISRNPDAPVIANLDALPFPAFHLLPNMEEYHSIPIEIGRGCPFACTFCSTSQFFRRKFRLKSVSQIVKQMRYIKKAYGERTINLTHDMFAADRRKVVDFCEKIISFGEKFTWTCSARTDCVDVNLITLMKEAGCRGIFFGVETGSERLQQQIQKRLNLSDAIQRIQEVDCNGIHAAVALITGFPDETKEDLKDTVHFFLSAQRFHNIEPQLSLLAPLSGSKLTEQYWDKFNFDQIFSDISHQGWEQDKEDLTLILNNPEIFSNFYVIPTVHLDHTYFKEVQSFLTNVTTWFRWLPIAIYQDHGNMLEIFDRWKIWKEKNCLGTSDVSNKVPYYHQSIFAKDFLKFVEIDYLPNLARAPKAIHAFWVSESFLADNNPKSVVEDSVEMQSLSLTAIPKRKPGLHAIKLEIDYSEALKCLRNNEGLKNISENDVTVVLRKINRKSWLNICQEEIEVRQLSSLSAQIFNLCDGRTSVKDMVDRFIIEVDGIPAEKVCLFGLKWLEAEGFVYFSLKPNL